MKPNLQHAIERVERPGGSHEGVGRNKSNKLHAENKSKKERMHSPGWLEVGRNAISPKEKHVLNMDM